MTLRINTVTKTEQVLEGQFREFREQASAFSRGIVKDLHVQHNPSQTAELNIKLTKALFSKWSIEILVTLFTLRSAGFEELRKNLGTNSSRVLSQKLKILENRKLLQRKIVDSRPPRSIYTLTEKGMTAASLGEPVILYLRWTEDLL